MPSDSNVWITTSFVTLLAGAALLALLRRPRKAWTVCPESERPPFLESGFQSVVASSLWPKRGGFAAACHENVARGGAPLGTVVMRWYERESCLICDRPLSRMTRPTDPIGLAVSDGTTEEWSDVEDVAAALAEYEPVCWPCHVERSRERRLPRPPSTTPDRKSGDS
jgi:hypothetical protein